MSRAFLYGRHSSAKQDLTQEVQHDMCLKYYQQILQPKGVLLGGWHYDPAVSSEKPFSERDEGRIVFLSAQPGDHIVTAKWSRAFRSLVDGTKSLEQLKMRRVTVHTVDLPVDANKASGRLVRNVVMSVDQFTREIAGEAQQEIMQYRMDNGLPYSRGVPVGWRAVGKKPHRRFVADQDERVFVEVLAKMRASGKSIEQIALWCCTQRIIENKRRFGHLDGVYWALLAREKGYPKISGFKRLRKMALLGQV
jgi:DNA invertase Pin-like site-specific DNA recombinase